VQSALAENARKQIDLWNKSLREFLHPEAQHEKRWGIDELRSFGQAVSWSTCTEILEQNSSLNGSLKTLDGLEVSMPGDRNESQGGIHLFGVNVKQGCHEWTVMHRYNDFDALKEKLGPRAESLLEAPFPGKFGHFSESMLEGRRKGLENWLQQVLEQVLMHPKSAASWRRPLQVFLHREHREAGRVSCSKDQLLRFAKATMDKIGEWYEEGKKHCPERCQAARAKYERMTQAFSERLQRLEDSIDELKALAEDVDSIIKADEEQKEMQ
jgi:hypothetical protein